MVVVVKRRHRAYLRLPRIHVGLRYDAKKKQPKIQKDHDKGYCTWAEEKQRNQQKLKTQQIKIHYSGKLYWQTELLHCNYKI